MSLRFYSVSSGGLWLDHEFSRGVTALLGQRADGVEQVLELAAGCQRPERGVVSLDQRPPLSHPATRAGVGTVFEQEWAPRGLRVGDWLRQLQQHHCVATSSQTPTECLGRLGVADLERRWTHALGANERRAALLALALGLDAPRLLALSNPFSIAGIDRAQLAAELARHAHHAVVLFSTPHLSDVELTGGERCVFASGRLVGELALTSASASRVCYRVTCDDPSKLCAALLNVACVQSVSAPQHARTLEIIGTAPLKLNLAILDRAREHGVVLENIVEAPVDLESLQAHARGRRDGEYRAGAQATASDPVLTPKASPDASVAIPFGDALAPAGVTKELVLTTVNADGTSVPESATALRSPVPPHEVDDG